jgi:hypothetical protein
MEKLREKWDDPISYARCYIKLTEDHAVVWWKLFNVVK